MKLDVPNDDETTHEAWSSGDTNKPGFLTIKWVYHSDYSHLIPFYALNKLKNLKYKNTERREKFTTKSP